mmetsp:Transcript_4809/g.30501  ORF Transcript_4809/g.30501 Transcript_4809/m.30501 type:complete len:253 (+) Transcript_4809:4274-5032(+)
MGCGHCSFNNAKFIVHDFHEWRHAVGCARCIGDDGVGVLVITLIHADHVGGDRSLARGSDQHLLGSCCDVLTGTGFVHEHASTFDNQIDLAISPWELEGISAGHDFNDLPIHRDVGIVHNLHVCIEGSQHGVVLEQMGGLLDTTGIIDGGHVKERVLASMPAPQEVASNTAESIDGHLDLSRGHVFGPAGLDPGRSQRGDGECILVAVAPPSCGSAEGRLLHAGIFGNAHFGGHGCPWNRMHERLHVWRPNR